MAGRWMSIVVAVAVALVAAPAGASAAVFEFPSALTSPPPGGWTAPGGQVGLFNAADQTVRQGFTLTPTGGRRVLSNINRVVLKVETPVNTLTAAVSWRLVINGTEVGTFAVPAGQAGARVTFEKDFPVTPGPFYDVVLTLRAPVAGGSHSFAASGFAAHSIELIDSIAPTTTLAASGPSGVADDGNATFAFSSPALDLAGFQCSLDGGAWTACSSPAAYTGLAPGAHSFSVRAADDAGNVDATPETRTWTVDSPPVCGDQTITVGAGSTTGLVLPCSDADGDALTTTIVAPPTLGSLGAIDQASQQLVFAAPQNAGGSTTFTYRTTARNKLSNVGTFTVVVGAGVVGAAFLDADGDGFPAAQDCNDHDPKIRPGAVEIKGNKVDENCDGIIEPFPTLTSGVVTRWNVRGARLTLTGLQITQQFPRGWKAKIKCAGKGCPFKTKSLKAGKVRRGASNVFSSLKPKQRRFRAGQTLQIWVSAPNFNTKVARLALRRGRVPTTQPYCVVNGESRLRKSCG